MSSVSLRSGAFDLDFPLTDSNTRSSGLLAQMPSAQRDDKFLTTSCTVQSSSIRFATHILLRNKDRLKSKQKEYAYIHRNGRRRTGKSTRLKQVEQRHRELEGKRGYNIFLRKTTRADVFQLLYR